MFVSFVISVLRTCILLDSFKSWICPNVCILWVDEIYTVSPTVCYLLASPSRWLDIGVHSGVDTSGNDFACVFHLPNADEIFSHILEQFHLASDLFKRNNLD